MQSDIYYIYINPECLQVWLIRIYSFIGRKNIGWLSFFRSIFFCIETFHSTHSAAVVSLWYFPLFFCTVLYWYDGVMLYHHIMDFCWALHKDLGVSFCFIKIFTYREQQRDHVMYYGSLIRAQITRPKNVLPLLLVHTILLGCDKI